MAAKAPRPKAEPRHEKAERDKVDTAFLVRYDGDEWVLRMSECGPADDRVSRQQMGIPIMGLFGALSQGASINMGGDVAVCILWMARRKNGKPSLSYAEVERWFPNWQAMADVEIIGIDANTGLPLGTDGLPVDDEPVEVANPES